MNLFLYTLLIISATECQSELRCSSIPLITRMPNSLWFSLYLRIKTRDRNKWQKCADNSQSASTQAGPPQTSDAGVFCSARRKMPIKMFHWKKENVCIDWKLNLEWSGVGFVYRTSTTDPCQRQVFKSVPSPCDDQNRRKV
jgi:hypothetical protein